MKTCCKCKENKELTEFCFNKRTKDGLNRMCRKCCSKKYNDNKEEINLRAKKYREKFKEKIKKQREPYFKSHRTEKAKYDKIYRQLNKKKIAAYKKEWEYELKNEPTYKIKKNLRRRLHHALMGESKSAKTVELLGCSIEEFMKYLESKFLPGMNWNNYGLCGWHVDHIIPCSAFDLTKENEQRKCFHHTNTQPLWESDNLKKAYMFNGLNCRIIEDKNSIQKNAILNSSVDS